MKKVCQMFFMSILLMTCFLSFNSNIVSAQEKDISHEVCRIGSRSRGFHHTFSSPSTHHSTYDSSDSSFSSSTRHRSNYYSRRHFFRGGHIFGGISIFTVIIPVALIVGAVIIILKNLK